ncbi:MAG TPA: M20 family metallopeptidase [Thermomicrobiaceae bacterium]|nr:M20 family metallopeptidase [Thermomicrobiaceae bacterium]
MPAVTIEDVRQRESELLDSLRAIVELESPSRDKEAVDRLARYLQQRCADLGGAVEVFPQAEYGDLTLATWPAEQRDGAERPVLVLTHIDTVWPLGTLARKPFTVEGRVARGPGVFDMKASVAMMLEALRLIGEKQLPHRTIQWLINTEEEVGSPVSRPLIEDLARQAEYVLVLEPPVSPHGALKTARKGVGMFTLEVRGRASHAGADHEAGISAIQELANQIQYLHGLTDYGLGTTVNVGVVSGGSARNVVAAAARAEIDVRVTTAREAERITRSILQAQPRLPGTELTITGGLNRPPMERTERIAAAFGRARELGAGLGLDLGEASTGGGSDGNFTAAAGAATIDGLGCPGEGAHAEHEHILLDQLLERTALLTALLTGL